MSRHPIDHDRDRDDAKVAKAYARIERQAGGGTDDPKVRALTRAAHADEPAAGKSRLKAFLKIDREQRDS